MTEGGRNMLNGFRFIESPSLVGIQRRTFKEFFLLKPRFKFYKKIPLQEYIIYGKTVIAHPVMMNKLKELIDGNKI